MGIAEIVKLELQPTDTTQQQWVSDHIAAKITGLSVNTLRAHRRLRKGIPYSKVGRSIRYLRDDVIAFMLASRIVPTEG